MPEPIYIALIPLLPAIAFVVTGLFGRKYFPAFSGTLCTLAMLCSFTLSAWLAVSYFAAGNMQNGAYQQIIAFKYEWLEFSPGMSIDMGALLDPVSVMMVVVVTFISLLVHIYSLGYMKDEPRVATFFSFLSLFTFSMLGLVLSSNIFQIYIFWELVGVSSFLLIGFYYQKPAAVAASKKAFIVTRFADLGFLIGILVLSYYTETFDFVTMITRGTDPQFLAGMAGASFLGLSVLTWGLVLVFAGGAGKSAMFPLHIWLPDAMEGPTPVSALIHAATMVVAGVYLVARLFPLFSVSSGALDVVAYTGAFSSLFAALIACTQTDIKRVLAFSTMSQIGFMMFALGVSGYGDENGTGYSASMFHLFTHAMFKALLFLGAGVIIHQVHTNDIRKMGGLRKQLPVTHITFLVACLAIAGIPPFAGFFSKEEILLAAWHSDKLIYYTGLFTAALTAFYMFRLYFSAFWGSEAVATPQHNKKHREAPFTMLAPLIVLALLSLTAGFTPFSRYISSDGVPQRSEFHLQFALVPVLLSVAGILLAMRLYRKKNSVPELISARLGSFYTLALRKFYIDEAYLFVTKNLVFNYVGKPSAWIDKNLVDGTVNGIAAATGAISSSIKKLQSGKLQDYSIYFLSTALVLVLLFVYLYT